MLEALKKDYTSLVVWGMAFTGITVLVALGKMKPETMEYLLFGLIGHISGLKKADPKDGQSDA